MRIVVFPYLDNLLVGFDFIVACESIPSCKEETEFMRLVDIPKDDANSIDGVIYF